jgi:hypothetical protein
MRTLTTSLLLLALGFSGMLRASAAGTERMSQPAATTIAWTAPVDLAPEEDYRLFPDANADVTRVVYLDFNQYDQPGSQVNIREIKVVEYQNGAWGNTTLIGSNGHYDAGNAIANPTKPVISGNGNTIVYRGYKGQQITECCTVDLYSIYYSDRSPAGAWSTPVELPEGGLTTHGDELSISQDGNTLIQDDSPGNFMVSPKTYISTRTDGVWGNPVQVYDGTPYGYAYHLALSPDGARAAFVATSDLYLLQKTGNTWGAPVRIVQSNRTANLEVYFPVFTADGHTIFYWEMYCAPIPTGCVTTDQNLKRIQESGGVWGAPTQVAYSDYVSWEMPAAINAAGTRAVFPVNGKLEGDSLLSTNLVYTDLVDGSWAAPKAITASQMWYNKHPNLSADGTRLVFTGPFDSMYRQSTILFSRMMYLNFLPLVRR